MLGPGGGWAADGVAAGGPAAYCGTGRLDVLGRPAWGTRPPPWAPGCREEVGDMPRGEAGRASADQRLALLSKIDILADLSEGRWTASSRRPRRVPSPPGSCSTARTPGRGGLDALAAGLPPDWAATVWLMHGCGLRIGEALAVRAGCRVNRGTTLRIREQVSPAAQLRPLYGHLVPASGDRARAALDGTRRAGRRQPPGNPC